MNTTCTLCLETQGEVKHFTNPVCQCKYYFHLECHNEYIRRDDRCIYCRPSRLQTQETEDTEEDNDTFEFNSRPVRMGRRNAIVYVFD